jgi:quinol monooxygenase YgiN
MIRVVAFVTAKPGRRDEALAAFREVLPLVRAEAGCIEYQPTLDADGFGNVQTQAGADTFVVIETWESAEALKAHMATAHMKAYAAKTKDLLANNAVHMLAPV